ncbi:MAG: alkaline phosphatase family protein [Candidatus Binatia bacterium]|nr:alkaline phosphatase family protein [Candidatus Binatia bacterium]
MAKILLLVLDGLADRPQAVLGGRTPLEAAPTPHLDRLAALGSTGVLVPLAPGIPVESELAHFLLFGYAYEHFPGRSAFEAIGRGIDVPPASVVFLASFATTMVVDGKLRRDALWWEEGGQRNEEDCQVLSREVATYETHGIGFSLQPCGRCEGILTLSGDVSRYVSDVDPFYNGAYVVQALPLEEAPDPARAQRTAAALNEYLTWGFHRLRRHPLNRARQEDGLPPINFVVTKWAAVRPQVPPFEEQNGMRAASVESGPLYVGIARVCGMTSVAVPSQPDNVAEELRIKLDVAEELFRQGYEFVHVHCKAPDVMAHRKDPRGKRDAIAALDRALGPLVRQVEAGTELLVVITGDHATPSSGPLIHSGEAVPLLIVGGPNVLADEVQAFHERAVVRGGLGRVMGAELMPILLNLTDRVRLHGVRHQRQARPYWQLRPEPFMVSSTRLRPE